MSKTNAKALNTTEARSLIASFVDRPGINAEQDYLHLHMDADAQRAIIGDYVGRMRIRIYIAGGYLVWLASRATGFGGDRDLVGAGCVIDDNLYCRRIGGNGQYLNTPESDEQDCEPHPANDLVRDDGPFGVGA